ncbi:hypothetical protein pah_c050o154 [Parachlamydia acanthamoebae str. Hall's coccus]|nr:hypothetical protein pah_c050o154 [Parachlamydia acanthamoebae str. Hall's coccus]
MNQFTYFFILKKYHDDAIKIDNRVNLVRQSFFRGCLGKGYLNDQERAE